MVYEPVNFEPLHHRIALNIRPPISMVKGPCQWEEAWTERQVQIILQRLYNTSIAKWQCSWFPKIKWRQRHPKIFSITLQTWQRCKSHNGVRYIDWWPALEWIVFSYKEVYRITLIGRYLEAYCSSASPPYFYSILLRHLHRHLPFRTMHGCLHHNNHRADKRQSPLPCTVPENAENDFDINDSTQYAGNWCSNY